MKCRNQEAGPLKPRRVAVQRQPDLTPLDGDRPSAQDSFLVARVAAHPGGGLGPRSQHRKAAGQREQLQRTASQRPRREGEGALPPAWGVLLYLRGLLGAFSHV